MEPEKLTDDELIGYTKKKMKTMQGRTDIILRLSNYLLSKYHVAFNQNDLDDTDREILKQLLQDEKNGPYGYELHSFMRMRLGDWFHFKLGRLYRKIKKISIYDIWEWAKIIYCLIAMVSFPILLFLVIFYR